MITPRGAAIGLHGWTCTNTPAVPSRVLSLLSYMQRYFFNASRGGGTRTQRSSAPNERTSGVVNAGGHRLTRGTASRSSQSMESNHPIRGYEPRPCTSTDCVFVSVTGIEPVLPVGETGVLTAVRHRHERDRVWKPAMDVIPPKGSAGPPAPDPWSGSVWS